MHNISVIIPTYNRKEFLERALNSVLRQTVRCREIIVVDDGSTDNTAGKVAEISKTAQIDIRYFRQLQKGPAAARNLGITHAAGEYIAFLDSDDHWHSKKLEKQGTAMLANPQYKISHTREKWLRRGKHLNQKMKHIPRQGDIFTHCLELCAVGMSTVMVKRTLFDQVGLFDPTLPCCEDYDLWLRISCRFAFLLVDEQLTIKEGGRRDQVSQVYRVGMDRFRIRAIAKLLRSSLLSDQQQKLAQAELLKKSRVYGHGCIKHGKVAEGEFYLGRNRMSIMSSCEVM